MPGIEGILQGSRSEIVTDLSWQDYCKSTGMNPSTLVSGIKPKGSLRKLKHCWDQQQIPVEDDKAPSGPLVWGRAAHTLLFESDKFLERYACWQGRRAGNEYKAFAEEARQAGAEVLNEKQFTSVVAAGRAFAECSEIKPLISSGKAEVSLFTVEEVEDEDGEIHSLQMKHRVDWLDGNAGIIDLKSTRNADSRSFSADVFRYSYDVKLGLYQRAVEKLTGQRRPVTIIVLEKTEPFEVAVMPVPDAVLDQGVSKALAVLRQIATAIKRNRWPGLAERELELIVPPWQMDDIVEYDVA